MASSSSPSVLFLAATLVALALCGLVRADSCVVTLYNHDSFASGMSFVDGLSAQVLQGGMFRNANTDIAVQSNINAGQLLLDLAPEGSRTAAVVNLGTPASIGLRYNINPPSGALYATIQYVDETLALFLTQNSLQPFHQSDIAGLNNLGSGVSFVPSVGSIYLVHESSSSYYPATVTKLMVLDYQPSNSVTFRFDVIQGPSTGNCVFNADQQRTQIAAGFEEPAVLPPTPPSNSPAPPSSSSGSHSTGYFVATVVVSACAVFALVLSLVSLMLVLYRTRSASYASIN